MPRRWLILAGVFGLVLALAAAARYKTAPWPPAVGRYHNAPSPPAVRVVLPPVGTHRGSTLDEVVLAEDFETTAPGALPPGWQQVDGDGGYSSWFDQLSLWGAFSRAGFSAHSGSRFAFCCFNDDNLPNDDWLILPLQNLAGAIQLGYWVAAQDVEYPESFEVRLSTTGTQPEDFTELVYSETQAPAAWTYHSHDLSAWAGTPFRIAFHYHAQNRFALKLDDITVEGTPAAAGVIAGTVHSAFDDTPIPACDVGVFLLGRSVRTDSAGAYVLSAVPPGVYTLRASHPYFYVEPVPGTEVAAGETTHVDISLPPRPLRFYDWESTNTPRFIGDLDTVTMTVYIPDTFIIYDVDVMISLEHTYVGDLAVWLASCDTEYVRLVEADPFRSGQHMLDCHFDDNAVLPFTAGEAPYTGWWQPAQPLEAYRGDSTVVNRGHSRGNRWRLQVADYGLQDIGTLYAFALHVAVDTSASSPAIEPLPELPRVLRFAGACPNPFNSRTRFQFDLAAPGPVELVLFNELGRQVAVILQDRLEAGSHTVAFDAAGLASGFYVARLEAAGVCLSRKIVLIR